MIRRFSTFNVVSVTLGFAFLYLPIVLLIIYSFNDSRLVTVWGGFSTRWYGELFHDRAILDAAWVTIRVALLSATVATDTGMGGGAAASVGALAWAVIACWAITNTAAEMAASTAVGTRMRPRAVGLADGRDMV